MSLTTIMRAVVISELLKDPLRQLPDCLVETAEPTPGKGEVLVDVDAAGLNFFDLLQVQGKYQTKPPLPFVAGAEFAGRVASAPEGSPFEIGTRVLGAAQGAFGERLCAKWAELIPVPDELSDEAASGIFITYPTSYAGLVFRANLQAGEWLLVTAAAGGVGLAACQIGKALGARVIAAAGSADKLDVARRLGGADEVVDYTKPDWQKEVMRITGGKGADVVRVPAADDHRIDRGQVYDPVGRIVPSLKCIAWNGRIIVVGFAGGDIEKIPANLLLLKQCSVSGVFWGAMSKREPERVIETCLLDLIAEGKLSPVVYERIYNGLEELPAGLKALSNRETYGKAVVRVRPAGTRSAAEAKL